MEALVKIKSMDSIVTVLVALQGNSVTRTRMIAETMIAAMVSAIDRTNMLWIMLHISGVN